MTYALGRRVEASDMPTLRAIVADAAAKHDYQIDVVHRGHPSKQRRFA